jgi:sialate O-acetylesterase
VGSWVVCSPDTVGTFSAVAYLFGRGLYEELNVPVGLLNSSMGGTRIETWSPPKSLSKFKTVMQYKAKEDAKAGRGKTKSQPWKYYPGKLYNGMIHPLIPYGMRGLIWYQGESNAHSVKDAILYRELLENLVVSLRADWGVEFPAYVVQLPNYKTPKSDGNSWQYLRESILNFSKEVPNVGMVVAIDAGDNTTIHPKDKRPIGHRLSQLALARTYGKDIMSDSPIYSSALIRRGKVVISFDGIGSGLVVQNGGALKCFTIAGKDRKFVPAEAVIEGDTVVVSSPIVDSPVAVRYAWAPNPVGCKLFNAEGFPASPFRTDEW